MPESVTRRPARQARRTIGPCFQGHIALRCTSFPRVLLLFTDRFGRVGTARMLPRDSFVEAPNPGIIVNVVDCGRQRVLIREMPAERAVENPQAGRRPEMTTEERLEKLERELSDVKRHNRYMSLALAQFPKNYTSTYKAMKRDGISDDWARPASAATSLPCRCWCNSDSDNAGFPPDIANYAPISHHLQNYLPLREQPTSENHLL